MRCREADDPFTKLGQYLFALHSLAARFSRMITLEAGGGLSRKCQIRACAAKRGLPPIPAFGIGWLYPVCLRLILRQSRTLFSSPRMRCILITRLTPISAKCTGK